MWPFALTSILQIRGLFYRMVAGNSWKFFHIFSIFHIQARGSAGQQLAGQVPLGRCHGWVAGASTFCLEFKEHFQSVSSFWIFLGSLFWYQVLGSSSDFWDQLLASYFVDVFWFLARPNCSIQGIPPAPRGVPQIEVTFDIDANGTVAPLPLEAIADAKGDFTRNRRF